MAVHDVDQIHPGMKVVSKDGFHTAKVVEVHPEPPDGTMADAIGYLVVEENLPDRTRLLHLPLTEILMVRDDTVVVEWDRDIVAAHNKQWFPENPVNERPVQQS